jgi:hypothetical protein
VSRFPEITGQKLNVIGVYIAWRGLDVNVPVAKFLTFWNRKSAGGASAFFLKSFDDEAFLAAVRGAIAPAA